ncbi:MAG: FeoB-associated Cys-rich membrane protein [Firmicutes bacterium]|nr:FeoB-associated Cys-rich membrane protein [Bacillota bacterium]
MNVFDVIFGAIIIVGIIFAVYRIIRNMKNGGCSCGECSSCGMCVSNDKKNNKKHK